MEHAPAADGIEPASLVFVCVDVEGDGKRLSDLYVELCDVVLSEDIEDHSLGILVLRFEDVSGELPRIAGLCGDARADGQCADDFSEDFHY